MILYKPWPDGWNYGGVHDMDIYLNERYDKKFVIIQFPWPCHDSEKYEECTFTENPNNDSWISAKEALSEVEFDYIVIYEPVEWTFLKEPIKDYYNFFKFCGIPMDKIIYQGANHEVEKYYEHANIDKKMRFKSVAFNHCLISSLSTHRDVLNDYTQDVKFDGSKLFICPMSAITDHRELLYNKLEKSNLLESGHVSARWKGVYLDELGVATEQTLPQPNFVESIIPYYEDSFCTVVTESEYDFYNVRFTEKFYFPIMYNRPFMILGAPTLLKWIKKYGFETFPELFDERYDEEYDLKKRTEIIIENLKKLQDKSNQELQDLLEIVKPKIIHNKNLLKKYANCSLSNDAYEELLDSMEIPLGEQLKKYGIRQYDYATTSIENNPLL